MEIEVVIRLSAFMGVLGLMASWELLAPRRLLSTAKFGRWAANLSIVAVDSVIIRLLFAAGAVGAALVASERNWGALNHLNWPLWAEFVLSVVILDFMLYVQHVMFHAVPLFWRFHMMHHADLDCDVTTGLRFHPIEVVFSMLIKLGAVVLIGAAPTAVLVFEIVLNATSMFNHSNVWMPAAVDRVLRWILGRGRRQGLGFPALSQGSGKISVLDLSNLDEYVHQRLSQTGAPPSGRNIRGTSVRC